MRSRYESPAGHPRARHRDGGFTLLELLVVLAIMGAMLAVVPRATAGLAAFRLHAAAAQLAETLRGLREYAVMKGRTATFALDARAVSYRSSGVSAPRTFPFVVDSVEMSQENHVAIGQPMMIRFFADGSATGATVTLHHGTLHARVSVDWLTGRVHSDD